MIIVCEPQCKKFSHEQVNSGFIYGLRLAYPQEKIIFFADTDHFAAIKNILEKNKVRLGDFEHVPISFNADRSYDFGGIVRYYLLFKKIFSRTVDLQADKIFFLSSSPVIIYTIKKLKQLDRFKDISCAFVLHGAFEDIANKDYRKPSVPATVGGAGLDLKSKLAKLWREPKKGLSFSVRKITWPFLWLYTKYSEIFQKRLRIKKMMLWRHSDHYHYIALSQHIVDNAREHIDTDHLNFYTVIMPTIFPEPLPQADNRFMKFAVFGYGDAAQMHDMLVMLNKEPPTKPYEIRIISMDNRGTQGFPNVRCLSDGKILSREEMEAAVPDIDVFINLYPRDRHRFGCSASIFEAFAYLKPVLYLSNDGYNYFNRPNRPIGFRTENMAEFVAKMRDMIENYPSYKSQLAAFRDNMLIGRSEYAIKNNLDNLRASFTFSTRPEAGQNHAK